MLSKRYKLNSFTLIELLVVIALIALVVTIVIVALGQAQARARDGERKAEIDSVRKALALYQTDQGKYPSSTDWTKLEEDAETSGPISQALIQWLPTMPKDPLYGQNKNGDPAKPYSYQYKTNSDGTEYKIHVEMESGTYATYETYSSGGGGIIEYGGGGGGGAYYLFLTSVAYNGNLGGRDGADEKCNNEVENKPSRCSGALWAFISINSADEISDMPMTYGVNTTRQWFWGKSGNYALVANNWTDLFDGSIQNPAIAVGYPGYPQNFYLTGSQANGQVNSLQTCYEWTTSSTANSPCRGRANSTNYPWLGCVIQGTCAYPTALLCACRGTPP